MNTRSASISRNPLVSSLFEATGITHNDRRVSDMFEREVRRHCAQPPSCSTRPISQSARRRPTGRYVAPVVGPRMLRDPTSDFSPCTPQATWSLRRDYCDAPSRVLRSRALENIERLNLCADYCRVCRRPNGRYVALRRSTPHALRSTSWPVLIYDCAAGIAHNVASQKGPRRRHCAQRRGPMYYL